MAFSGFGSTAFGTSTFGAPASTSATPAFGTTSTATTPAFGGFGSTTFPSLSTTSTSSTPSFGTTSSATPSLFGGSTATPTLGTTSTANPFGTTPSLFGATTPATTSPFGTTTTPAFGSTATTPANPFGTFGTTTTTPTTTPSLFPSTPAFGSSFAPSATTTSSLFPTTPAPTAPLFGTPAPQPVQPTQPAQQTPLQKIEAIYCCFNPQHPQCKFRHMFYNQVNASPDEVKRMNAVKPPQVDQLLWDQACRNNPDPSKFVPVQACGFEDLKQRIGEQNKLTTQQTQTLQDATKVIDHIKHQHANNTMVKLEDYKRRQLEISQRLIRVMCKLMVLEAKGTRLTVAEEQLKRKFEMMLQDLSSPVLYRAKIEDFIALSRISVPSSPLPQLDDKALETVAKALKDQRAGLEVLTSMVQKDAKDVQLMMNELAPQQ